MQTEVKRTAVYVYEAPVRLWHWINAFAITALAITGWFIANPPPTIRFKLSNNISLLIVGAPGPRGQQHARDRRANAAPPPTI